MISLIKNNIESIRKNLPENVTLIAVSKTRSISEIQEAYNTGIRDFAENKVQELISKTEPLNSDIRWHLIGHLQKNKVKYIVGKVFLIHSLDSIDLLNEIEKRYKAKDLTVDVLIQINIGREESKDGLLEEDLDNLIQEIEKCSYVKVQGLMSIIPKGDEAECRSYFKKMNMIFNKLSKEKFKNIEMQYLSMGMSGDYLFALSEGSNMIRIGQGIFGKREYKNKEI